MEDISSYVYWADEHGRYDARRRTELATKGAYQAAIADLNQDDYPDLVIANSRENDPTAAGTISIFWGDRNGISNDRRTELPAGGPFSTAIADFNRDGYLDIVSSNVFENSVKIWWGSSTGFSEGNVWASRVDNPRFLSYADLNGDGYLDLLVPSISGNRTCHFLGI